MYNETQKQKYLVECKSRNQNLIPYMTVIFDQLEHYETILDKDACDFEASEIIGFYKYLCTSSFERLDNINGQLKYYTAFCLTNHLVKNGQNNYASLTQEVLFSCINQELAKKRIVSRKELLKTLHDLENPVDKVLILGQFEGINGNACSEFIGMKAEDVSDHVIHLNSGRKLKISDELISLINEAADTYKYYALNVDENNSKDRAVYSLSTNDKNVFKVRLTGNISGNILPSLLERRMITLKKYIGAEFISRKALQASGRIEFIKMLMKKNNISLDEAIRNEETNTRYTRITSVPRFIEKYGSYFEGE